MNSKLLSIIVIFILSIVQISVLADTAENIIISFPGEPSYVQNQADAFFSISITTDLVKNYTVSYSIDAWKTSFTSTITTQVGITNKNQSISHLPKGIYDIQVKVSFGGVALQTASAKISIIEYYKPQFLDDYSRISVATHFSQSLNNQTDVPMLNRAGIKVLRDSINWSFIENSLGVYNFNSSDAYISLINDAGIETRMVITVKNKFHTDGTSPVNNEPNAPRNTNDVEACVNFVKTSLTRYPQVKMIEIYNEPNLPTYWGPKPNAYDYANLVKAVSVEVGANFPNVEIMAGAVAPQNSEQFSSTMLNQGLLPYIDYYSFHPYIYPKNPDDGFLEVLQSYTDNIEPFGGWVDVASSEVGWTQATGAAWISDEQQANYVIKNYIFCDQEGLAYCNYYNFRDKGTDKTNKEHMFGLITNDFKPKLAYIALSQQTKMLNNAQYVGFILLKAGVLAFVYLKEGKPLLVAWSPGQNISFDFAKSDILIEDIYGNPVSTSNFTFKDSPVYVQNISNDMLAKAVDYEMKKDYSTLSGKYANKVNLSEIGALLQNSNLTTMPSNSDSLSLLSNYYDAADKIVDGGKGNLTNEEFMFLLYKIHLTGEKIVSLYMATASNIGESSNQNLAVAQQTISNRKSANSSSVLVFAQAILKFASRYNKKANDVAVREEHIGKAGIVASNHYLASRLSKWSKTIALSEEILLDYKSIIYTSKSKYQIKSDQEEEIGVTLRNNSGVEASGTAVIVDDEGKFASKFQDFTIGSGQAGNFSLMAVLNPKIIQREGEYTYKLRLTYKNGIIKEREFPVTITLSGSENLAQGKITTVLPTGFLPINSDYLFSIKTGTTTYQRYYLLNATNNDSSKFFLLSANAVAASKFDADGGTVMFDLNDKNNIGNWLNTVWLDNEWGTTEPSDLTATTFIKDNTYRSGLVPIMRKYVDLNHKWLTESGKSDSDSPTNYAVTCGISLLSLSEFNMYYDKIGNRSYGYPQSTDPVTDCNWWLRTPSVSAVPNDAVLVVTPNRINNIRVNDNSSYLRPCFYINKDFFKEVKLDVKNIGIGVKKMLRDNYEISELSQYTDDELTSLGFVFDYFVNKLTFVRNDDEVIRNESISPTITANFEMRKQTTLATKLVYIIAVYDENKKLIDIKLEEKDILKGVNTYGVTVGTPKNSGYFVKAMAIKNATNLVPVCKAYEFNALR